MTGTRTSSHPARPRGSGSLALTKRVPSATGGYSADHPVIKVFWRVVEGFTDEEKRKLLKFVTSCSRPPLLGFKVRDSGPLPLKARAAEEGSGVADAAVQGSVVSTRFSEKESVLPEHQVCCVLPSR